MKERRDSSGGTSAAPAANSPRPAAARASSSSTLCQSERCPGGRGPAWSWMTGSDFIGGMSCSSRGS